MTFKYRKKPLAIEAYHWLFDKTENPTPIWLTAALYMWPGMGGINYELKHSDGPRMIIATLEGDSIALPGDYIIRGVEGEIYPCKQSVFEASYDKVEAEEKDE